MKLASQTVLQTLDTQAEALKRKIRESPDEITVSGKTFYVSLDGNASESPSVQRRCRIFRDPFYPGLRRASPAAGFYIL